MQLGLVLYASTTDVDAKEIYRRAFADAARCLRTIRKIFGKGYVRTMAGEEAAESIDRIGEQLVERLEAIVGSAH